VQLTEEQKRNLAKNTSVLVESLLYDIEKHFPELCETDEWKQMSEEGKRATRLVIFERVYGKSPAKFAQDFYDQAANAAKFVQEEEKKE
jgi:hypothetical protein